MTEQERLSLDYSDLKEKYVALKVQYEAPEKAIRTMVVKISNLKEKIKELNSAVSTRDEKIKSLLNMLNKNL